MARKESFLMNVSIPNKAQIQRRLQNVDGSVDMILSRAINRAISNVQSTTSKAVNKKYKVTQKSYKEIQDVIKAKKGSLYGRVKIRGIKLSAYPSKDGLSKGFKASPSDPVHKDPPQFYKSQILKAGGLKQLDNFMNFSKPFITDTPKRGIDFYRRIKGKTVKGNKDALIFYRPTSTVKMLNESCNPEDIKQKAIETMHKRIDHEINRVLAKESAK